MKELELLTKSEILDAIDKVFRNGGNFLTLKNVISNLDPKYNISDIDADDEMISKENLLVTIDGLKGTYGDLISLSNIVRSMTSIVRIATWLDNHNGTYTCSHCGCQHSKSKFCPDCGYKMK